MIVLHYTGMKSGKEALERLCDPASKVSCHYLIDEDGKVYNLVDENKRAWHAGVSYWRGMRNVNANSVGIEIVNPGHEFGYREFTRAQYESVITVCQKIKHRYIIENVNIVGHSDIAPDRKKDPGELFNWKLLAENNLGLWPAEKQSLITNHKLTDLDYENHDQAAIIAFQRHWRQDLVNGIWDDECNIILHQILTNLQYYK